MPYPFMFRISAAWYQSVLKQIVYKNSPGRDTNTYFESTCWTSIKACSIVRKSIKRVLLANLRIVTDFWYFYLCISSIVVGFLWLLTWFFQLMLLIQTMFSDKWCFVLLVFSSSHFLFCFLIKLCSIFSL